MKKKYYLFSALAFLISTASFAQVSIGLKGGANFSGITYKDEDVPGVTDNKDVLKPGFNAGLVFRFGGEHFAVQPEIFFSQKGNKRTYKDNGVDAHDIVSLNYLEVPVLFKALFGDETIRFYLAAGPYVGYLVGGQYKSKDATGETSGKINLEKQAGINADGTTYEWRINRLDFGGTGGIGLEVTAGPGTFFFDARYGLGLSDINKITSGTEQGHDRSMNRNIMLSVGILFPLSK